MTRLTPASAIRCRGLKVINIPATALERVSSGERRACRHWVEYIIGHLSIFYIERGGSFLEEGDCFQSPTELHPITNSRDEVLWTEKSRTPLYKEHRNQGLLSDENKEIKDPSL